MPNTSIEFVNSYIRDQALAALGDSFIYSDYHEGYILRDESIYSSIDEDWYMDDSHGLTCCEHNRCSEYYHREVNLSHIRTEDNGTDYCSDECATGDDQYQHEDGSWYDTPESNGAIQEYHTGDRTIRSANVERPYRIGFEVEKADNDVYDSLVNENYMVDGWIAENDSSIIGEYGFELISPAYNLADRDDIVRDIRQMSGYIDAESDQSCGGHITISKYGVSGIQLAEENRGLFPLLMCLYPARLRSSFVKSGKYETIKYSKEKYRPFNIDDTKIELRIISRVMNVNCLVWRLDLLKYMLENDLSLSQTRNSLQFGWLREHLSIVYSVVQLEDKLYLFDEFAKYFYDLVSTVSSHVAEYLTQQV